MSLSTDPPPWWTPALASEATRRVAEALPAETGGLFFQNPEGSVALFAPPVLADEVTFAADPAEVVRFAYSCRAQGNRVLGSFHSHPNGRETLSCRDHPMLAWGEWHALFVPAGSAWRIRFWRRQTGISPLEKSR
ncbi:Mov34/MPN/PAD-1 family protein [Alicyclobacillus macrosporangiidus]|uniref:Mov34/MPN/PAD-1 family protein n=1 Tax=Alicyclobacillus macrosporangiidus TaxID=392015 RepID=UPI0018CC27C0|nr:Mov34/MPN/PAD-1 family protein [Alicyclobacillus macrosporangiidus]